MNETHPHRSFEPNGDSTLTLETGQRAHHKHVEQSIRLTKKFYEVCPGVWNFVGNGLSNQTFIQGPGGIVAIDTGESKQEMASALRELRAVTSEPVVAVLYTHFHYVAGTQEILDHANGRDVPIWGHAKIDGNRARAFGEISPAYTRGVVEQFGIVLPSSGPDGIVNVGLGFFFRNPEHAPFTGGYVSPTHTFDAPASFNVAGLDVQALPAPSDADDSATYWFPSLGVAVNNIIWPTLFNVFAIRGEEYRDPRILLRGIDQIIALNPDHLVASHGPPISGREEIRERATKYRDAIQFLWDQSVRSANRGLTNVDSGQLTPLPAWCDDDYLTSELYGVAEHHFRQIRTGLFGFFDGDEANLFPLNSNERSNRLVQGLGGRDSVRAQLRDATASGDLRWGLELGSWLVRSSGAEQLDRDLLAETLRVLASRTPAANIRDWCITRARSLDGTTDMSMFYQHNFNYNAVVASPPETHIALLRVTLDPDKIIDTNVRLAWRFPDGHVCGLHIRNSIACPYDGRDADATLVLSIETWAAILCGRSTISQKLESGDVAIEGDLARCLNVLGAFEVKGLQRD